MKPHISAIAITLTAVALNACGTKSALVLPPGPAKGPLLGGAHSAAAASTRDDSHKDLPPPR